MGVSRILKQFNLNYVQNFGKRKNTNIFNKNFFDTCQVEQLVV